VVSYLKDNGDQKRSQTICLLSAHFWPYYPRYGTAHPYTLAKSLVESGYRVKVVTTFPQEIDGSISPRYDGKLVVREPLGEMELIRVWTLQLSKIGILKKILYNVTFSLCSLFALLFVRDSDLVFGVDPDAPFLFLPSRVYSLLLGSKYLVLVTDLWPDVVFDYKIASSGMVRKLLTLVSVISYRCSDLILVITHRLRDNIQRYSVPAKKVEVVELGVDLSVFRPIELTADDIFDFDLSRYDSSFVVLYSGSLSVMYDFGTLLDAAHFLRSYEDILFIIRGQGEMKDQILNTISDRELSNVVYRGVVPEIETVVKYINLADVCVIPLTDTPRGDITHPSKLFEFWACGKPVIVLSKGELSNLVNQVGAGTSVPVEDAETLARAILAMYHDRDRVREMGAVGLDHVDSRFSTEVMRRNLSKTIKRIL